MAGAGFKTFNTGDVLTASDVNTYLMQQTVMVFADSSARSTALGANVAEGMISYLKDTNAVEVYNGSAWVSSDDPNAIQNTIVDAKGDIITATAADTPARLAVGANGYTLVADSSTSTGLAYGSTALANPAINGAFDIWQRGTSIAVNATTYTADRWCGYRGVAGMTVSRQSVGDSTNLPNIQYCTRIQRDSGNTSTTGLQYGQMVETVNAIPFAGRTVTLSFYARKGANYSPSASTMDAYIVTGTGTDQNYFSTYTGSVFHNVNATLTTTWQRFSGTFTLSSTLTEFAILMNSGTPVGTAGANDYFEVTGVQIDLGSTALPFRRSGGTIEGELAACQRYYQAFPSSSQDGYALFGSGYAASTTKAFICLRLNGSMRTYPTMSYSAGNTFAVHTGASTVVAGTAIGTDRTTAETVWFNITVASGLTAGNGVLGIGNNTTSAKIEASSEL